MKQFKHKIITDSCCATAFLIMALFVLRLPFMVRFELGTDEAHYALYGAFLDWSYYDHPPMVGWLMALSQSLWGYSDVALRVLPLIFSSLTLWFVYIWARWIYPLDSSWVGFRAVLLVALSPSMFVTGFAMIPETPLNLFAMGVFITIAQIAASPAHVWRWIALGVLLGLCGLSKYTAILIPLALVLTSLVYAKYTKTIFQKANWRIGLAVLVALLSIVPIIVWNHANDWLSISYQWGHVTDQAQSTQTWSLKNLLKTLVGQLVGYLPLFSGGLFVISRLWKESNASNVYAQTPSTQIPNLPEKMAAGLWVVWVLVLVSFSGFKVALPHWSQLAWLAASPLIAYRWHYSFLGHARFLWLKRYRVSLCVSVLLLLMVFGSVFYYPTFLTARPQYLAEVRGWQRAAHHADELRQKYFSDKTETKRSAKIFVQNWTLGSRIAWPLQKTYLKQNSHNPKQNSVQVLDRRFDQFDLWFGTPPTLYDIEQGEASPAYGILVEWSELRKNNVANDMRAWGMQCEQVDQQDVNHQERRIAWFRFWHCVPSVPNDALKRF